MADSRNNTIRKITSAGVVTTLAGAAGVAGFANGTGLAAQFNDPQGVAVDGSGNLYVTDYFNQVIRKITPAGVVTTLAGTAGSAGYANGTGAAALFNGPTGVAVDASGNVYVGDTSNEVIRKITSAGVVTTLAGTAGTAGYANGTGPAAMFSAPEGVAVDSSGNVYVADVNNDVIRKITSAGVVTTLAGAPLVTSQTMTGTNTSGNYADGVGAAAIFYNPIGVAVDANGNVYVADFNNYLIREITPSGVVTTLGGYAISPTIISLGNRIQGPVPGYADGTGEIARFNNPFGVAVDSSGNLYIADSGNNTVRKGFPSAGPLTTNSALAASVSVDNHLSGDTVGVVAGGTAPVTVRFKATDTANALVGIRYNIWNPPSGSVSELQGYTTYSGSGNPLSTYVPASGGSAETDQSLALAAGKWYFWTDSVDSNDGFATSGAWTAGFTLNVVTGTAPAITSQPQSTSITTGSLFSFSVTATGSPVPTYQWYLNGAAISGATGTTYAVGSGGSANAGSYTVIVSNSLGSVTSSAATLTVNAAPVSSGGSGGGGGGAPSWWFYGALALAFLTRLALQRRRTNFRRASSRGQ